MVGSIKNRYQEARHLLRESWSMGWPMILMMFFHFSIGLADVYVAGYLGTKVLAAVGYVGQLYWTLMILANGITVGTVSMVSQAHGAGSAVGVGNVTANSLVLGAGLSGLLTGLTQIYAAQIVNLAGMPDDIQGIAEEFIRIFSLVLVPTYAMITTSGVLRATGRVRIAMVNSFVASVLNVALDFLLAFGWGPVEGMGYRGIAWATATATTVGMLLNLIHMFVGPAGIRLHSFRNPISRCTRNLLRLGIPSALQQTAWNAGTLVVYFLVARLPNAEITALAAMTAGLRIEAIIYLPIFAFNMACAVMTGNKLGSGDIEGARSVARVTAALCLSIILLPAVGVFIAAPVLSTFISTDPEVLAEMTRYLRINMVGMPFLAVGISLSGALSGAGDTLATMRIIFTGMWLVRIPLILTVMYVFRWDASAVWWSLTISISIMCFLLVHRFRSDAWTRASVDTQSKTMLWQACVEETQGKEAEPELKNRAGTQNE